MNEQNQNGQMSVYDIPVATIAPNPYQPRLEFDDQKLSSMADSISRYGVMQPIVVTQKPDGSYELISGERRLRASKIAGKETIPAVVRDYEHSDEEKFELAIIENIQREDLSPVDKAKAFKKLNEQFGYTHSEIAQKMGKSREYISNSLRLLLLPDTILAAMVREELSEGHARPLLMLKDRPYEQGELFKKIVANRLTVRAAEKIARSIATEKLRKLDIEKADPEIKVMEKKLAEKLGTKVSIDEKTAGEGGKLTIEYFSKEDLEKIISLVRGKGLSAVPNIGMQENTESGIEKFENNFSPETEKTTNTITAISSANVFADEISSLEKQQQNPVQTGSDSVSVDVENIEVNEDQQLDGYNISFGAPPVQEEEVKEDIIDPITEKAIPETNEVIDNFGSTNWQEQEKENNFQKELDAALNQKTETIKDSVAVQEPAPVSEVSENVHQNIKADSAPVKHDITELTLDKETVPEQSPVSSPEAQNIDGKTEAQRRIDDILAGRKTVAEEYNVPDTHTEKQSLENNLSAAQESADQAPQEDIADSSIYQQFLASKKKVEEQKERMFSGTDTEEVNNIGSFSEETLEATGNIAAHTGNENSHIETLQQERDMKSTLTAAVQETGDTVENTGAEVENVFGGGDFVPTNTTKKPVEQEQVKQQEEDVDVDSKYSFKGFSI